MGLKLYISFTPIYFHNWNSSIYLFGAWGNKTEKHRGWFRKSFLFLRYRCLIKKERLLEMVGDQMNRVQFRFIFSNGRKIFLTMIRWQIASRDFSSTSELWFPLSLSLSLSQGARVLARVSVGFKVSRGTPFFRDRAADVRGLSQFSCLRICRVAQMLLFAIFTPLSAISQRTILYAINGRFTNPLLYIRNFQCFN